MEAYDIQKQSKKLTIMGNMYKNNLFYFLSIFIFMHTQLIGQD